MTGKPWQHLNIGKLGRVVTGSTPRTGDDAAWGDEIDFVTPTEMSYSSREPSKCRKLSPSGMEALKRRVIPAGSTLFACIGFSTGKVAQIFRPAITNQQVNALIPNPSIVDERFAYYLLRYKSADIRAIANGSTTPIVNKSMFQAVDVLLPFKREQEAIADVLGVLDDKIAVNEHIAAVALQLSEAMFRLLRGAADEEATVGDLVDFKYGRSLPAARRIPGEFPVFGSGGISGSHDEPLVKGPGIVIGRKGTVGVVYWSEGDFFPIDTTFYVVCKNARVSLEYMYFALRSLGLEHMNSDSAVPGLNRERAQSLSLLVPATDAMQNFTAEARKLFRLQRNHEEENRTLATLRDTLLPQLMSGRLRVKDAEKIVEDAT